MPTPFVVEKKGSKEVIYDIYSKLLEDRIIFIGNDITDELANDIIVQLLLLDQKDSTRDIRLYINSSGGSITAGLAIYDTIKYIRAEVSTVCIGMAASMAAVLLSSGTKGKRFSLPNSRIMIHEPRQRQHQDSTFTVSEQIIDTDVIVSMRDQLAGILADNTGQSREKIVKDIKQDFWLNPTDAVTYGIIDSIITTRPED
jgi:ATP-dependent Clp protease, protease subunit